MKVRIIGGFLGAGKTSAIRELARLLCDRGERVAIVTNDQGRALVDTELVRPSAAWVREIGGGCFCCRFEELEAALGAAADSGASIALAEAVGSCTDLLATVLSPLAERAPGRFQLEPLSIVVDPWRVRDVARGAFTDDVAYLYRKQIEEADVVVLSRSDLGPPDVEDDIRSLSPEAAIVRISSATGAGLASWLAARPARPAAPLMIDYDRYAAAEASLGWFNGRARVSADFAFDPRRVLARTLEQLESLPIAHLKIATLTPAGGAAAIVRRGGQAELDFANLPERTCELTFLLNARVALPARELEQYVRDALAEASGSTTHTWEELACFEPARPVPVHRHAFRCGTGDDGSCCAAFYDRSDVRYLLGESFHPGGAALTLSLAKRLGLERGARLVDVACGQGASLRAVLGAFSISAVGLDSGAVAAQGDRLTTVRADAHAIPFDDGSFDAALCECALSTFRDPARALSEMRRVLRPGARMAVSDMIVEGPIPESLRPYAHTGACLAGARTFRGWNALFEEGGFQIVEALDESSALRTMLGGIKRKLLGVALAKAAGLLPAEIDIDVSKGRQLLREADATVAAGHVRYGTWIVARRDAVAAS